MQQPLRKSTLTLVAITLSTLTIWSAPAPAHADGQEDDSTWHYSIEFDPAPFIFDGFGGVASVRPTSRWKIGIAAYALTFPEFLVRGENDGFGVEIRPSFNLLAGYSLRDERGGWFIGAQIRQARTRYTHSDVPMEQADVTYYEIGLDGGYIWYPLADHGFFAQFWGTLEQTVITRGDPAVGDRTFKEPGVTPYIAVHLGYEI